MNIHIHKKLTDSHTGQRCADPTLLRPHISDTGQSQVRRGTVWAPKTQNYPQSKI